MAWYRCGGGGIPSSLKSDMDDVFNKKFGTVLQDYPPEDWPETVNLMGPLPEKTVSGSVVAFSDGADDVPLKSCEVTIAPTLDGISSVDIVKMGGNFIELYTRASNAGISYSINDDGSLHREGTANGNSFNNGNVSDYASCPYKFKAGTYTLSVSGNIDNNTYVQIGMFTASGASVQAQGIAGNGSKTFTVNEDFGTWYYCKLNSGVTVDDDVYIWINAGETSLPYDKKIEPTTHTANLGRTIHGGEVDVVNGTGTDENGNDFTFTPVPILSRLGDNTMWGDGDLSVTYRRDIDLALAQ